MLASPRFVGSWPGTIIIGGVVFSLLLWSLSLGLDRRPQFLSHESIRERFPLAWKHIHEFNQTDGAWYIPQSWEATNTVPKDMIEAAQIASSAAGLASSRQLPFSNIPLIVHQMWNDTDLRRLDSNILRFVERWLSYATAANQTDPKMAYFFWGEKSISKFVKKYEPEFFDDYNTRFSKQEKADIFRMLVCKWFGGIFGDVNTEPLKHPIDWIRAMDIAPWTDNKTGTRYGRDRSVGTSNAPMGTARPINLLLGLEADTDPDSDQYRQLGFDLPIQLSNWAMASHRHHPITYRFMDRLQDALDAEKQEAPQTPIEQEIKGQDQLTRTGPAMVTNTTRFWLQKQVNLQWNAVTGRHDGGRAKLASDVLILPITGFSPGRGRFGNMGSKPFNDPDARLARHNTMGWYKFDTAAAYGKICRIVFGGCREGGTVPSKHGLGAELMR